MPLQLFGKSLCKTLEFFLAHTCIPRHPGAETGESLESVSPVIQNQEEQHKENLDQNKRKIDKILHTTTNALKIILFLLWLNVYC